MNFPIFLIGTQRSGTTLLTRMLSAHKRLYIQNEMGSWGVFDKPYTPQKLQKRVSEKLLSHKVNQAELEKNDVYWGWKDPMLTPHIFELAAAYPEAFFIVLVRDPRAVVASYIENSWGLGTNVYTGALRWKSEVSHQVTFFNSHKTRCIFLKYESLVEDSESCLKRICEAIGVEFSKSMLDFYQQPLEFAQNASNVNTKKPINRDSLNKWKRALSKRQIKIINAVCKNMLHDLDYTELTECTGFPSKFEVLYYKLHQSIVGEYQLQYQLRKARRARQKK